MAGDPITHEYFCRCRVFAVISLKGFLLKYTFYLSCLFLFPLSLNAQASLIYVRDFEPASDPSAPVVAELIRTGIAQGGLFSLVDHNGKGDVCNADILVSGSVETRERVLIVTYMVSDSLSGRVRLSKAVSIGIDTMTSELSSIAESIENAVKARTLGATVSNVEKLIALEMWQEASYRLEPLLLARPQDEALAVLAKRISAGQAADWFALAKELVGTDSSLAREAMITALLFLPETPEWMNLLEEYVSFHRNKILPAVRRDAKRRADLVHENASRLLKAEKADEAEEVLLDFMETEGLDLFESKHDYLLGKIRKTQADALFKTACAVLEEGAPGSARALALKGLALDPENRQLLKLFEKASMEERLLNAEANIYIHPADPLRPGAERWFFEGRLGLRWFDEPHLDYPIPGNMPVYSFSATRQFPASDILDYHLSASFSHGYSTKNMSLGGSFAAVETRFFALKTGLSLAIHRDRVKARIGGSLAGEYVHSMASYQYEGIEETVWNAGAALGGEVDLWFLIKRGFYLRSGLEGTLAWYVPTGVHSRFAVSIAVIWAPLPSGALHRKTGRAGSSF